MFLFFFYIFAINKYIKNAIWTIAANLYCKILHLSIYSRCHEPIEYAKIIISGITLSPVLLKLPFQVILNILLQHFAKALQILSIYLSKQSLDSFKLKTRSIDIYQQKKIKIILKLIQIYLNFFLLSMSTAIFNITQIFLMLL